MYFSRITLSATAGKTSGFWKIFQSPYTLHQSIWEMFSDHADRNRDFIYRLDNQGVRPVVYVVSSRLPKQDSEIWAVESKPYAPKIETGTRLSFMLRANPVVSRRDENNKQHRHDVVMDLKTGIKAKKLPKSEMPTMTAIVHEAGLNWLVERAEKNGFFVRPDDIRADGYRQERFTKRKGRQIRYSTLDFSGQLSVTEPDIFLSKLIKGIGSAKGFGCGLMLVKRV